MTTLASLLKHAGLRSNAVPVESVALWMGASQGEVNGEIAVTVVGAALNALDRIVTTTWAEEIQRGAEIPDMAAIMDEYDVEDVPLFMDGKAKRDTARATLKSVDLPIDWFENWASTIPAEAGREQVTLQGKIVRTSEEKRVAYAIVYSPRDKMGNDSWGDWMEAGEIEKMAWSFLERGITRNTDTEHAFVQNGCAVVESFIVRHGDSDFPDDEGAWAVAIRFYDNALWEDVKSGKYTGVSLAGITTKVYEEAA